MNTFRERGSTSPRDETGVRRNRSTAVDRVYPGTMSAHGGPTARRNWSLEETQMAFALYYVLPPSECDDTGDDVQHLARCIHRSPNSVALKIWNIAANDSNRIALGKVGMTHGSKLDKEV